MTQPPIGSLAWARRGGGRLGFGERLAFAGATIRQALGYDAGRLLRRLGLGSRRQVALALAEVPLPATADARAAAALCEEVSSPALANHCHRTYLWGALLAARDGVSFDPELFWVASLLHDLGLTERFEPRAPTVCFAFAGGEEAERFVLGLGWAPPRAERVAEAICRHLNPRVTVEEGPEAHLLRQGSGLDIAGLRLGEIAAPTRAEVLERHPRLGLKAEVAETLVEDTRRRPHTRLATLCSLGFAGRVRRAPFPD
ncbi:MAG TPA: HD domain-containing protein [Thermoanaerobaculia bacterium]|nr:HD domain-containing protein [Thermoanaerobaculia bacterium]